VFGKARTMAAALAFLFAGHATGAAETVEQQERSPDAASQAEHGQQMQRGSVVDRAHALERAGQHAEAIDAYVESVKSVEEADLVGRAGAKEGLSRSLAALGLFSEATVWARSALVDWQRAEAKGIAPAGRKRIVMLLMRLGEYESAVERADELAAEKDSPAQVRLWAREQALRCALRLSDWPSAAKRASELAKNAPSEGRRLWAMLKLAETRAEMRDFSGAASAYRAVSASASGQVRKLADEKLRAAETMQKLYGQVGPLTLAVKTRSGHEMQITIQKGARRRRQSVNIPSFGEGLDPSMDEFQRRSALVLKALARQLAERRGSARPILGVSIAIPLAEPPLSRAAPEGVAVTSTDPGSPAEKMGLEPGDVIMTANGVALGRGKLASARLISAVNSAGAGARLTLEVRRGKGKATVSGVLGEYEAKK